MAESMTARLATDLRRMILEGELAPGSLVVEPKLAEQFGVSKTPVREALRLLTTEGLLAVLPKKGYLVATMSSQDVAEVLDLRMLLEPHSCSSAAAFADPALVRTLRDLLDRQREHAAAEPLKSMEYAADFHRALAAGARNRRLSEVLARCFDETSRAYHVLPGLHGHLAADEELAEHEAVYAAVAAGDGAAAAEAMRAHLRSIRSAMARQFERPSGLWS